MARCSAFVSRHACSLNTELLAHTATNLARHAGERFRPSAAALPGRRVLRHGRISFFDPSRGLEYLFGTVTADTGEVSFRPFWATDRAGEKRGFEQFVEFLWERLGRWPGLHVYHYAHYEPTALKRLMSEHATREEELDELLRREVFVDLFQVVVSSMRIRMTVTL